MALLSLGERSSWPLSVMGHPALGAFAVFIAPMVAWGLVFYWLIARTSHEA